MGDISFQDIHTAADADRMWQQADAAYVPGDLFLEEIDQSKYQQDCKDFMAAITARAKASRQATV